MLPKRYGYVELKNSCSENVYTVMDTSIRNISIPSKRHEPGAPSYALLHGSRRRTGAPDASKQTRERQGPPNIEGTLRNSFTR